MEQIFLRKNKSKESSNVNNSLAVSFRNSKRIIPYTNLGTIVNESDVYNEERQRCSKIRLNCVVRPYCTNALFNAFTEITQNEGSDKAVCLNFLDSLEHDNLDIPDELFYKVKEAFAGNDGDRQTLLYNMIDDTQLSSKEKGNLTYHCGLDFFNNHILRSNTFKSVTALQLPSVSPVNKHNYYNFNTLCDYHRRYDGSIVSGDTLTFVRDFSHNEIVLNDQTTVSAPFVNHIYTFDDILSFNQCVKDKLIEENGWMGFINKGKLKIYDYNNDNTLLDISKPLNNKDACEFVDMYPTRDLFSFAPKYNNYRHRIEKNWNYLITYPSSSTRQGIPCIDDRVEGGALRLFLIDTSLNNIMRMHSMSKHGLVEGDYVMLYRDGAVEIPNLHVTNIVDEYTFDVENMQYGLAEEMKVSFSNAQELDANGSTTYKIIKNGARYCDNNSNFLTYSFKKLDNGVGVEYYVRIFSQIPNWKFATQKITEKAIYDEGGKEVIENNQKKLYNGGEQFENNIAKLSFSKTIYNDEVAEIIFTDDIDIDYLHDNLGRPLSSIYLTIIKNNKGYYEWYETNGEETSASTVEYSHCFGRVSCGFMLNENMYDVNYVNTTEEYPLSNTRVLCESGETTQPFSGLNVTLINDVYHREEGKDLDDTVNYYYNNNFYGDLCYYCPSIGSEVVIQDVDYRFNTYQREHSNELRLNYSNIKQDDYDTNDFSDANYLECKTIKTGSQYEGYYYKPHYEIQIKSIGNNLNEQSPKIFTIRYITNNNGEFKIFTNENNYIEKDDIILMYLNGSNVDWDGITNDVTLRFKVTNVIGYREFICMLDETFGIDSDKNVAYSHLNYGNKSYFRVLKKDMTIPSYATFLLDGSCKFVWRDIIQNGFDNDSNIESYPFTNGCLYVMKDIDFFLKRQNPMDKTILTNHMFDEFKENIITVTEENKYYEENKIKC